MAGPIAVDREQEPDDLADLVVGLLRHHPEPPHPCRPARGRNASIVRRPGVLFRRRTTALTARIPMLAGAGTETIVSPGIGRKPPSRHRDPGRPHGRADAPAGGSPGSVTRDTCRPPDSSRATATTPMVSASRTRGRRRRRFAAGRDPTHGSDSSDLVRQRGSRPFGRRARATTCPGRRAAGIILLRVHDGPPHRCRARRLGRRPHLAPGGLGRTPVPGRAASGSPRGRGRPPSGRHAGGEHRQDEPAGGQRADPMPVVEIVYRPPGQPPYLVTSRLAPLVDAQNRG